MTMQQDPNRPLEVKDSIVNDYVYSYGGVSRFFRDMMEHSKLTGTKCPKCAKEWCPPRVYCPDCYEKCAWVELPTTGVVKACTFAYYVPSNYALHKYIDMPYVLALIQIDGTASCLQSIVHVEQVVVGSVKAGDKVKAVFREKREGKLTDVYFVPVK